MTYFNVCDLCTNLLSPLRRGVAESPGRFDQMWGNVAERQLVCGKSNPKSESEGKERSITPRP